MSPKWPLFSSPSAFHPSPRYLQAPKGPVTGNRHREAPRNPAPPFQLNTRSRHPRPPQRRPVHDRAPARPPPVPPRLQRSPTRHPCPFDEHCPEGVPSSGKPSPVANMQSETEGEGNPRSGLSRGLSRSRDPHVPENRRRGARAEERRRLSGCVTSRVTFHFSVQR